MRKKQSTSPLLRSLLLVWIILTLSSSACYEVANANQVMQDFPASPSSLPPVETATSTPTQLPTTTSTLTPTATITPTPTNTPTATLTPTYAILRAQVLVRANCRYGPGAPYLYKYGLVVGSNLEVIGRNDLGTWILIQAIGGNNPCWVKASLMDIKGDVMSVAPTYIPLPQSPYYGPPTGVWASREGDNVTISWNAIKLRAGDETAQTPYLIEAWVCLDGQLIFTPIGPTQPLYTLQDQAGCVEPSHGRVFYVEKHGYTRWVEIPWPPAPVAAGQ
ncbi:MAG: hypothetical protein JSV61_03180 [Anaerolineales bacterium]|nr:MAG: hypothetical protein JSV61_03180 [Anaerolineales bacterium]